MSSSDPPRIVVAPANASFDTSAADHAARAAQAQERIDAMEAQLEALNEILAKPLDEILAERDKFKEAAAAWDAFGAMWMLSQRAMKRVALDLAAQQGVSEQEVVSRALTLANSVLNGDGVDLGGTIAEPQMAHIERHRAMLRKQFRQQG
jgi:hypothetical protein